MLLDVLRESYALSLSPGFFQFYAEMGILHALEETKSLNVTHVSGASAGALVGGFLASGVLPSKMTKMVFSIGREDMWDMGIGMGLLRGQYFQNKLEEFLPVKKFDQCKIPLGVTAYDCYRFRTNCISEGDISTAIRASCCFPVLFQPVMIDSVPHIDGGIHDSVGLMALPGVPESKLILNVVCGRSRLSSSSISNIPEKFQKCRLITLVMDNAPFVNPFNMKEMGPVAYSSSKAAMITALCSSGHIQQLAHNHWCVFVDCSQKTIPVTIPKTIESSIKLSDLKSTFSFTKRSSYEKLADTMNLSVQKKRTRENEQTQTQDKTSNKKQK